MRYPIPHPRVWMNIIWFTEESDGKIYKIHRSGDDEKILVAGTSNADNLDGPLNQAVFRNPHQVSLSNDGNIAYVSTRNSVRAIDLVTEMVTTLAGPTSGNVIEGWPTWS